VLSAVQRSGLWFVGALAAAAGVYELATRGGPRRRRRRRRELGGSLLEIADNPWRTLSNRRRVLIADDGRIERGLPEIFHGAHVQDVPALSRAVRELEREGQAAERRIRRRRPLTFRNHDHAVRALLEANPPLVDFLETECSHDCLSYRQWLQRGRRGPKPAWRPGDGRFDAVNERLERRGARKVASWLEAVYTTPPASRRWSEFPGRLASLEEATGLRLNLPAPAEDLDREADDVAGVRRAVDERIDAIVNLARTGRLKTRAGRLAQIADVTGGEVIDLAPELEDAPF
jgi:hypothetical protein